MDFYQIFKKTKKSQTYLIKIPNTKALMRMFTFVLKYSYNNASAHKLVEPVQ